MSARKEVKLTDLQPQQLSSLKEQFENELEGLGRSSAALQNFATEFHQSSQAIEAMGDQKPGAPMMLPLTQSLYVEGELADADHVLVDIGTGYYLQKSLAGGVDYCKRRVQGLADNVQEVHKLRQEKAQMLYAVEQVMQQKMAAQQKQQAENTAAVEAGSVAS